MSNSAIKHHCVSLVLLGVIFGYLLGRISKNTPTTHMSNLPNWVSEGPSALSREFKTGTSQIFPMHQFGFKNKVLQTFGKKSKFHINTNLMFLSICPGFGHFCSLLKILSEFLAIFTLSKQGPST